MRNQLVRCSRLSDQTLMANSTHIENPDVILIGSGIMSAPHHPDPPAPLIPHRPPRPMKRIAFKMKLKPGFEAEYQRRHDALWPELAQALRDAGISDYSIFLDAETRALFAVQKRADDSIADRLPDHPIVKKWWASMAPLMEVNPDNSPVTKALREVFHLD